MKHFNLASNQCELCSQPFLFTTKLNSLCEFKMLDMTWKEKNVFIATNLMYILGILCNFWTVVNIFSMLSKMIRENKLGWKFNMILLLCVTTNMCILLLSVLITQAWFNLFRKILKFNQSTVIISRI